MKLSCNVKSVALKLQIHFFHNSIIEKGSSEKISIFLKSVVQLSENFLNKYLLMQSLYPYVICIKF